MKILIATFGTRGDVEPFVHLSRVARERGHEVTVLTTEEFHDSFDTSVHHVALPGSVRELIAQTNASPLAASRIFTTVIKPLMVAGMNKLMAEADRVSPDIIVYHPKIVAAPLVASKVGAVAVQAEFAPITVPTATFASAGFGTYSLGLLNRVSYGIVNFGSRQIFARELATLRREWGVDPAPVATIVAVSPTLVPQPSDYPSSAWITGQWNEKQPPTPLDEKVRSFCAKPTIAVTFGSMVPRPGVVPTIIASARRLGLRTLFIGGWSGIDAAVRDDAEVMTIDAISHDEVFPLCELVIHHGGAGTTHAAARAGVPQWIVPVLADQPWWKAAMEKLGIEVGMKATRSVSVETITKAIAGRSSVADQAKLIAAGMSSEDGCANAVNLLESLADAS